ncbi:hypothetical protein CHUAL_005705 [Chamberlinius hualienensis]
MDVEGNRGNGIGRRWRSPGDNEDENEITLGDDSSDESSSSETQFPNLWLPLSKGPNKPNNNLWRPSKEYAAQNGHGRTLHKKRIITPSHKLRSSWLHNKKLRLEKGKNHQKSSPTKSRTAPPEAATSSGMLDHRICESRDVLPVKDKHGKKKVDKLNLYNPRHAISSSDTEEEVELPVAQTSLNSKKKYKIEVVDLDIPSTSSGIRRQPTSNYRDNDDEDDDDDALWFSAREDPVVPKKVKNPGRRTWAIPSSSDDELLPVVNGKNNASSGPADLLSDDSSDSDNELSWIGPSPRSLPSSSTNLKTQKTSQSNVNLSVRNFKPLSCTNTRKVNGTVSKPIVNVASANNSKEAVGHQIRNQPVVKNSSKQGKCDGKESAAPVAKLNSRDGLSHLTVQTRHSSDADSSSSDLTDAKTSRRRLFERSPRVNILNSSESEDSSVPAISDEGDAQPGSPGIAEALRKIQQIEDDEAFARQLQLVINSELYENPPNSSVGNPIQSSQSRPVVEAPTQPVIAAPLTHTHPGIPAATTRTRPVIGHSTTQPQSIVAAPLTQTQPNTTAVFRAPVIPNSTNNPIRATRSTFPRHGMSGRAPVHNPNAAQQSGQTRSPQTRVLRPRHRRPAQPLTSIDTRVFSESFDDDPLFDLLNSLDSEDELDHVLALHRSSNRQHGRRGRVTPSLDEVIRAVMDDDDEIRRNPNRTRTIRPLLRRRSPRGQRQIRSFAVIPLFMNDRSDYEDLLAFEDSVGAVPVGLNRAQIHRLPTKQYSASSKSANTGSEGVERGSSTSVNEDNCHICLCDYDQGDNLRILPCFHNFHAPCIDRWLQTMYGLLLENLAEYIRVAYGEEKWEEIRRLARVDQPTFSTHRVYPDNLIPRLAQKATKVLNISENEFFESMGLFFVDFVGQYGYDRVLSVLGRNVRDFINGLDNLHEYLKFSYPRMKAPSFFCENENQYGLTLHYRSKRKGYVYYTMGQIKAVGKKFYNTDVTITVLKEELLFDTEHVTFQLSFENTAFLRTIKSEIRAEQLIPVQSHLFFAIFPFCIVFGNDMIIRNIGHSLHAVLPDILGQKVTDCFVINRPLIDFNWKTVLLRTNNIFELITIEPIPKSKPDEKAGRTKQRVKRGSIADDRDSLTDEDENEGDHRSCLTLKGQMMYMTDWNCIIFLAVPLMQDLNALVNVGLYINDLSMHDFSRDLMLAGTQQSVELNLALDQEQLKSKRLEESMKKLDEEMKRTDELLYQMIPKAVADRLRNGEPAVATCEVFDCITILFSDVVNFTEICSRISPMEVVSLLNSMYSIFDKLTSRHQVYKVETIGDAYMVVSGAPEKNYDHAHKVCGMALDMIRSIGEVREPSTGDSIAIRIGVHSGTVVSGVVGLKMPRYCFFGDTVNTASRMESTSQAMRIHISESTKVLLNDAIFETIERGTIAVKGKGHMKTYWLERRTSINNHLDLVDENLEDILCPSESSGSVPTTNIVDKSSPSSNRSLYSPVTFDEVVRHQRQLTPIRKHAFTWNGTILHQRELSAANNDEKKSIVPVLMESRGNNSEKPIAPQKNCKVVGSLAIKTNGPFITKAKSGSGGTKSRSSDSTSGTAILLPCLHRHVSPINGDDETVKKTTNRSNVVRSHYCSLV